MLRNPIVIHSMQIPFFKLSLSPIPVSPILSTASKTQPACTSPTNPPPSRYLSSPNLASPHQPCPNPATPRLGQPVYVLTDCITIPPPVVPLPLPLPLLVSRWHATMCVVPGIGPPHFTTFFCLYYGVLCMYYFGFIVLCLFRTLRTLYPLMLLPPRFPCQPSTVVSLLGPRCTPPCSPTWEPLHLPSRPSVQIIQP